MVRVSPLGVTDIALAVVLGSAFGLGVCLLVSLAPRWGAPSLARRIAPYIRDVTDPRGRHAAARHAGRQPRRAVGCGCRRRLANLAGGSASLDRRLHQAGWAMDAAAFRGRQLAWAVARSRDRRSRRGRARAARTRVTGARALLPPLAGVIAAFAYDARLTHAARARVGRIQEELPTVLEFLALCLSAGEGILDSLRRVSDVGAGELTARAARGRARRRHRLVPVRRRSGACRADSRSPPLSRSIDQLVAAIDRGAPLAHVLHSQALDAREDAKRGLIERAGRKEIYMLIPLVFLILPLSVLFAVFPGIFMLRLGIG